MTVTIDADGRFSGYASVFGRLDGGGDIVMPGAFRDTLKSRAAERVRLLFQHDPKEPIGLWDEIVEDGFGLRVAGRLLDGVPRAQSLKTLIAQGALDGLSIGFRAVRATREARTGTRRLWAVDLWEISIVTFPMMEAARIRAAPPSAHGGVRKEASPLRDRGPDTATLAATLGAATRLLQH